MPLFKNSINGRFYNHSGPIFLESVEAPDGVKREGFFLPLFLSFAEQVSLDTFNKVLSLLFSSNVPKLANTGSDDVFLTLRINLLYRFLAVAVEPTSYVRMS